MLESFQFKAETSNSTKMDRLRIEGLLFFGGGKAFQGLHRDTVSGTSGQYHVMLSGRKRWICVLPRFAPTIYASPGSGETTFLQYTDTDMRDFKHRFPAFARAEYYDFISEPGDIVWIPSGTFHVVEYLEASVAFTYFSSGGSDQGLVGALRRKLVPSLHMGFLQYQAWIKSIEHGSNMDIFSDTSKWFSEWAVHTFPITKIDIDGMRTTSWSLEFHNMLRYAWLLSSLSCYALASVLSWVGQIR